MLGGEKTNKQYLIHSREGDWKKNVVQGGGGEKNSCRVNCTVWLTNCTYLKDTSTDTIFNLSSPITTLHLAAENHGKCIKTVSVLQTFLGDMPPDPTS